jgi:AraC-like DNA-binding protein
MPESAAVIVEEPVKATSRNLSARIAGLMGELARNEGRTETPVPGVALYRTTRDIGRRPLLYRQGVIIVGQGAKNVHLGGEMHTYDPDHYLVLSVPLPAECEATVRPDEPLLSLLVDFDMPMLQGVIAHMDEAAGAAEDVRAQSCQRCCQGLALPTADAAFKETVLRLLRALASPLEARVLGPGLVRELFFRIMCGEAAASLRALAVKNTGLSRIEKALRQIHSNYDRPFHVEELAGCVNMSTSAFHRAFKDVTSLSPIQYLKKVRLNKAMSMLVEEGVRASEAARLVGYESVSQFSREFKRYFGASPGRLPEPHRGGA